MTPSLAVMLSLYLQFCQSRRSRWQGVLFLSAKIVPTAKENHPKTADAVILPPILPPNQKAVHTKDLVGEIITITVKKMKITGDLQSIDTDLVRTVHQGIGRAEGDLLISLSCFVSRSSSRDEERRHRDRSSERSSSREDDKASSREEKNEEVTASVTSFSC